MPYRAATRRASLTRNTQRTSHSPGPIALQNRGYDEFPRIRRTGSPVTEKTSSRNCLINRNSCILGSRERVEWGLEALFGPLSCHLEPRSRSPPAIYQTVSVGNSPFCIKKGVLEWYGYLPSLPTPTLEVIYALQSYEIGSVGTWTCYHS